MSQEILVTERNRLRERPETSAMTDGAEVKWEVENFQGKMEVELEQHLDALQNLQAEQELWLEKVESSIKKYKNNLFAREAQKLGLEASIRENKSELEKIQKETAQLRADRKREIQNLKQMKNEAEEYLKKLKEEESKHALTISLKQKEMENAYMKFLQEEKEKFEDAETLYKSRELALNTTIKHINSEVQALGQGIVEKENLLKKLKADNKNLENQYFLMMNKKWEVQSI